MSGRAAKPREKLASPVIELLVIVVNFQTPELTIECLRSISSVQSEVDGLRAIVVENGSNDASAGRLAATIEAEGWGTWVSLSALPQNVGFARGVNHGYRQGSPARWLLLLNSDARLHAGSLSYCCARMRDDPTLGAISCLVLNADGSVQNVARRFPTPLRLCVQTIGLPLRFPALFDWADIDDLGWDRRSVRRDVDWLGGAFLLLRGDLIERIGLLDGDFFFYGEDIELCHRVKRAGFRCRYDPGAEISHIGAASSEGTESAAEWRRRQLWSARYLVLRKCHGRLAEWVVRTLDLVATAARANFARIRRGPEDPKTRAEQDLLRILRGIS